VNFLHPVEGTPMAGKHELTPFKCLKVLVLFRLVCPSKEIRASGGRELNLRSVQALALYPANSIFIGDYLTTEGQSAEADRRMIADTGFEIEVCAVD
jgi:biotin synthase